MTWTRAGRFCVVALVAIGAAQGGAIAADPLRITKPVNATSTNLDPGRLYSSPAFAIDPKDPMRAVAGFADLRTRRCGVLRTSNGGRSWAIAGGSPALATYPFCSQSQGGVIQAPVAFGRNGTVYMALNGWDDQDGARPGGATLLARSNDLGETWQTGTITSARGKTGEQAETPRPVQSLAVDTSGDSDVIYVTYNLLRPGFTVPNAVPASPVVAVSRDGGRTFAEPYELAKGVFDAQPLRDQALRAVTATTLAPGATTTTTTTPPADSKAATPNQAANFGGAGGRNGIEARVDGKGTAYVFWRSGTANVAPAPPPALFVSTSRDRGRTWSAAMSLPFEAEQPSARFAVSAEGVFHMIYGRNPRPEVGSLGKVFHRASTDGGKTWSEPRSLTDDDPSQLFGQYFPNISVAPNGRVDAVWWDTRDDIGIRANDAYYSYSNDNGATWSANQRITDQSVDRRFGVWGINYDINSPPGVGSAEAYTLFGWDDTRHSRDEVGAIQAVSPLDEGVGFGGGLQDVFISAVQFEEIGSGGTSSAVKAVLAGLVGLVLVGCVLLVASLVVRRRAGAPEPAKTTEARTPVG